MCKSFRLSFGNSLNCLMEITNTSIHSDLYMTSSSSLSWLFGRWQSPKKSTEMVQMFSIFYSMHQKLDVESESGRSCLIQTSWQRRCFLFFAVVLLTSLCRFRWRKRKSPELSSFQCSKATKSKQWNFRNLTIPPSQHLTIPPSHPMLIDFAKAAMSSTTWKIFSLGLLPIGRFSHVGPELLNVTEIGIADLQQAMLQKPSRRSQNMWLERIIVFKTWWVLIWSYLIHFLLAPFKTHK